MKLEDTKMCIYRIHHLESDQSYIGQTTNRVGIRWNTHCLPSNDCVRLKNAIQKYGRDAFEFTVIALGESKQQLNTLEQYWIKELNTLSPNGYNLECGGSYNKIFSEETRKKMSKSRMGMKPSVETKEKQRAARIGSKRSLETRQRMATAQQGRTITQEHRDKLSAVNMGKTMSPEHRKIMSEVNKGKIKSDATKIKTAKTRALRLAEKDALNPPSAKTLASRAWYQQNVKKIELTIHGT